MATKPLKRGFLNPTSNCHVNASLHALASLNPFATKFEHPKTPFAQAIDFCRYGAEKAMDASQVGYEMEKFNRSMHG